MEWCFLSLPIRMSLVSSISGEKNKTAFILAVFFLSFTLLFVLPLVAGLISVRIDKVCPQYDYNQHSAIGNQFYVWYCSRYF
jgi:hypothetical protein